MAEVALALSEGLHGTVSGQVKLPRSGDCDQGQTLFIPLEKIIQGNPQDLFHATLDESGILEPFVDGSQGLRLVTKLRQGPAETLFEVTRRSPAMNLSAR